MSMAQEIDYTTLKWVKAEIDESLNQTRQALEAYVENPGDSTQIRFCTTYLHQIYGTLQMVEIYGAALLAEEMEHLAHAIAQEKIQNKDDAYDVLMRAIIQLPSYLEHLEQGQQDMPVILLPLLNDLRSARGEHLLSENAFFSPDLKVAPPTPAQEDQKDVEIKKYAKKLRSVFQSSLVGLYRNQDVNKNLKKIGAVLRELINSSNSNNASRLWWVSSGVIEALLQSGLELNSPIKQMIGQIDPYIKNLMTKGEQVFEEEPPSELLKNMLYYVAMANSTGKRVTQIKTAFNLEQILPSGNDISDAFNKLRGSNTELMKSVSAVIKEDLLQIKDQLDVFVRSTDRKSEDLSPFVDQLSKISDTLAMLGLGDLHKIIRDQIATLMQIMDAGTAPTEANLMEIASSLLFIESSLEGIESTALVRRRQDVSGKSGATLLPDNETLQLNNLVIAEASEVMVTVKNSFNAFANDPDNPDIIKDTPAQLNQVRGVLSVLAMPYAANILHAATTYINVELLEKREQPNQAALDALADVISSIEYYLESITEGRQQPDSLLRVAEDSMARLGIDVEAVQDILTSSSTSDQPVKEDKKAETIAPVEEKISPAEPTTAVADSATTTEQAAEPSTDLSEKPEQAEQPEQDIDEEILEIFLEEADEVFEEMQSNLQAWKGNHSNEEAVTVLRRSYHTLKGSGRLAGAIVLGEFAWSMENMLNQIIKGKLIASPQIFQLMSTAELALNELLNQLKDLRLPIPDVQPLNDAADALTNGETLATIPGFGDDVAQPDITIEEISEETAEEKTEPTSSQADVIELPTQDSLLGDIFRKETETHLNSIQAYLDNYSNNSNSNDGKLVTEPLLRALHTLHGSARMANVNHIAEVSEALHRYFRTLNDSSQNVESYALKVLTDGSQIIHGLLGNCEEEPLPDNYEDLLIQIKTLHDNAQERAKDKLEQAANLPESDDTSAAQQDDVELIDIFLAEAKNIVAGIKQNIETWHRKLDDVDTIEELQRALNTLKGSSRMANIMPIANLSLQIESLLQALVESQSTASEADYQSVLSGHDWLTSALDDLVNKIPIEAALELTEQISQRTEELLKTSDRTPEEPSIESSSISLEFVDDESVSFEAFTESTPETAETAIAADEDDDLFDIFLEEAQEIQESNENTLQHWSGDYNNPDHIADLQRSLHTLKGGARMAKVSSVADLSHALETFLECISEGKAALNEDAQKLIHETHDWLGHSIDELKHRNTPQLATDLIARLEHQATVAATPDAETKELASTEAALEQTTSIEIPSFSEDKPAEEEQELSIDDEVLGIFLEEAEEIQETTDKLLHEWAGDYTNKHHIAEMQRALHTLKGGARMANLSAIGDLSHSIESLLESVTEDRIEARESFPKIVHLGHDWLVGAIDNVKNHRSTGNASHLIEQLENLAAGNELSIGEISSIALTMEEPQPTAELIELPGINKDAAPITKQQPAQESRARTRDEQIRVRAELLDNLVNHASEASIYNSRIGQQMGSWKFNLAELTQTVERLQGQLRKFEIETEAQIMYRHAVHEEAAAAEDEADFDPLELDRFSYMQQLSRGLVESLGDLTSIQDILEGATEEADVLLLQQSRINSDLQEGLMRTRLTPFSSILPRLRRIVRQTCTEIDKEAQLVVEGAEGEMDRTQLNRVVPALEHILRNAVDHGIELPKDREKAGKESYGTINLAFTHEGSEVVLTITDDGTGIDLSAIRKKAIERGLMNENAKISDKEVTEFILESGFSTADKVTQISGRGVGMDVVNTEIKQLNGSFHIETTEGKGSRFIIRLPLTVLTNQALLVSVDEKTYALQLSNIEHIIRVSGDELGQLSRGEMESYDYAGLQYDALNVGRILHRTAGLVMSGKEKHPMLLCRSGDHRVAVLIDHLVGRQEIVVKSVGAQLSTVNNISGATILPNGDIALILDLSTLIRSSLAIKQLGEEDYITAEAEQEVEVKPINVMIVDDSITVRKVTERLLTRHNFDTITAKDGVDALTQLLEVIPDIMLLDVEMPRMDGYELATAIRNDDRLKHLPIIMITSRTGEKHVERAMKIGVNMVMGKPFQEHDLLENMEKLLPNLKPNA